MTRREGPDDDGSAADRAESDLPADALPEAATGCWVVHTVHTVHLFDLDNASYARLPGPGRRRMPHDGTWLRLLRFEVPPRVGARFVLFVDDPDPAVAAYFETWRVSSTVVAIEATTHARLDDLRASPPGRGEE